jgi:YggT family protein
MSVLIITVLNGLSGFLKFYMTLLTIRIYLTWFPNINFFTQPFYSIAKVTDPYLRIFRGIIPSIMSFDMSPLLGFMLITFLIDICSSVGRVTI